jgi:predicted DsbA family dithiol-disulfide isomerase
MKVEIWSDVVCPWCYVGKRRLERALAAVPWRAEVELRWRSFQLDPSAPRSGPDDPAGTAPRLAAKYGTDLAGAHRMNARMEGEAAREGVEMRLDRARGTATLDAHRLAHEARAHGVEDAVTEALMRAYFTEGRRIDDPEVLADVTTGAGLPAERAAAVLGSDAHAAAVRAEHAEAVALGATGVPFVVLDRRYGVAGAQPVEVFLQALERARADAVPVSVLAGAADDAADACGPDGCAV